MSNSSSAAASPSSTNCDSSAPFVDYKLISQSTLNAPDGPTRYNIMKFHSANVQKRIIDPQTFTAPVRLTRKNIRAEAARQQQQDNQNTNLVANSSGVPNRGGSSSNGVDNSNQLLKTNVDSTLIAPHGGGQQIKKNLFKKKTRQVFIPLDPDARKLRREEYLPWVLEDYDGQNTWVGNIEASQSKGQYMLFVFAEDGFKVVPAHRWYKLQQKQQFKTLDFDQAEEEFQKHQKNDVGRRWMMKKLNPDNPLIKNEQSKTSTLPTMRGGKRLRTVDTGPRGLFRDDEDDEGGLKKSLRGGEDVADELDFEEEFADDEDGTIEAHNDEEAKELEEKIKREMRLAERGDEAGADEDDVQGPEDQLTNAGKEIKKVLRHLDRGALVDSDEERNPYASSEESDPESTGGNNSEATNSKPSTPSHSSIQKLRSMAMKERSGSNGNKGSSLTQRKSQSGPPDSRSGSPGLLARGIKSPYRSRGVSPAAVDGTRKRRHGGDAGSGGEWSGGEGSGGEGAVKKIKLKLTGTTSGETPPPSTAAVGDDNMLITEEEVANVIRGSSKVSTKDLLQKFRPQLRADPRNREVIMTILKKIATLSDGMLILK